MVCAIPRFHSLIGVGCSACGKSEVHFKQQNFRNDIRFYLNDLGHRGAVWRAEYSLNQKFLPDLAALN